MNNTVRYAAGDWFLVARERGFALLPNTVPISLLETVWETLDTNGGLAGVIDKLTGAYGMSLSAIPPFAMAIMEQDDLRVAVRGGVRVAYDDGTRQDLITGGRVQTWVEQAIPPYATIVVTPPDARIEETMLPIASGVVRTGLVTIGTPDEAKPAEAAEPRRRRRRKADGAEIADEHDDGAGEDAVDEDASAGELEEALASDPHEAADDDVAAAGSEHVTAAAAPLTAAAEPPEDAAVEAADEASAPVEAADESAADDDATDVAEDTEEAAVEDGGSEDGGSEDVASEDVAVGEPEAEDAAGDAATDDESADEVVESVDEGSAAEAADEPADDAAVTDDAGEEPASADDVAADKSAADDSVEDDAEAQPADEAVQESDESAPAELSDDAVDEQFAEIRDRELSDDQPVGDHDGHTLEHAFVRSLREEEHEQGVAPDGETVIPTVFRGRAVLSTGRVLTLDRVLVVGRRPRVTRTSTGAVPALVAVDSPTHDISRNHIEIRRDGESVLVTDLNTTNGTVLLREGEDPRRLHPGEAMLVVSGDVVDIGDEVTVTFEEIL